VKSQDIITPLAFEGLPKEKFEMLASGTRILNPPAPSFSITQNNANNSEIFTVLDNGRVGIGTEGVGNPGILLDVLDSGATTHLRFGFSTGFFWSLGRDTSTGALAIADQGGQKLTILNSGNVGIATTTPYAKLSVTNTDTFPSFIVEDTTSPDLTPFVIDASGNVGIGVAAPSSKLHVSDTAQTPVIFTSSNDGATDIQINNTSTNGRDWILSATGQNNSFGAGKFGLFDSTGGLFRLIVDSAGDFGVGTTTPSTLLDVYSTASTTITVDSSSGSQGGCIKIRDADGAGYTYLSTLNGVALFSTVSCE